MVSAMILIASVSVAGVPQERLVDLTAQWEVCPTAVLKGFHNLYNPCVIRDRDRAFPFKMWFFGWPVEDVDARWPGDVIFFARGRSIDRWEVYAGDGGWENSMNARAYVPVLRGEPKAYDGMANGDPSVVFRKGVYHMALSSVGFDTRKDGQGADHLYNVSCVLGATSPDGIHWQKTKGPIAIWKREFEKPWEIIDGKIPHAPDGYYGSYHRPALMYDEGRWKLWFDYFVPGTFVSMGYAENRGDFADPSAWTILRADEQPLLRDWPNPSVVKVRGRYYAFSDAPNYPEALGGDSRQVTMAVSRDGLEWRVLGHIRPDGLASSHVPQAVVFKEGGIEWLYVFYSWKPERAQGEAWDFRYKQIRHMRCRADKLPK